MKSTLFALVAVALLGLLAYTNPTLDSYQEFVHQSILRETKHQENPLEQVLGSLLGGVASYGGSVRRVSGLAPSPAHRLRNKVEVVIPATTWGAKT